MSKSDKTLFLRKYTLAQIMIGNNFDSYSYSDLSKICSALLEAAELRDEITKNRNTDKIPTLKEILSKIENNKFIGTPKLMDIIIK